MQNLAGRECDLRLMIAVLTVDGDRFDDDLGVNERIVPVDGTTWAIDGAASRIS